MDIGKILEKAKRNTGLTWHELSEHLNAQAGKKSKSRNKHSMMVRLFYWRERNEVPNWMVRSLAEAANIDPLVIAKINAETARSKKLEGF